MAAGSQFGRYAVIISFVYVVVRCVPTSHLICFVALPAQALTWSVLLRWGLPVRLLLGLEAWGIQKPKPGDDAQPLPAKSSERQRSSKHDSVAKRAAKQELTAPGAETLLCRNLTVKDIQNADYYSLVELLVCGLRMLMMQFHG